MTASIDRMLDAVRRRISMVTPTDAFTMQGDGALIVDTRPAWQRSEFGEMPGAVCIERNHLEWRLDPTGSYQHPAVVGHAGAIVVFCQEGYSSSLAVGTLVDMGIPNVHDLAGGFVAWVEAGLPVRPGNPECAACAPR